MEYLKKILAFVGAAVYGWMFANLLWFAFHYFTLRLMVIGWWGVALCAFLTWLVNIIPIGLIFFPLAYLAAICPASRHLPAFFLLVDGLFAVAEPWRLDMDFTFVHYVIAVLISYAAIKIFTPLIFGLSYPSGDEQESKNNRWTVFAFAIISILFTVMMLNYCGAQNDGGKDKDETTVGDYVYMDVNGTLHTMNGCPAVFSYHGAQPVTVKSKNSVIESDLKYVCSKCVTDEQYATLRALIWAREIEEEDTYDED